MHLKEFTSDSRKRINKLNQALRENFNYDMELNKMDLERARRLSRNAKKKMDESNNTRDRLKYSMIIESLDIWSENYIQKYLMKNLNEGIDDDSMEEAKVILAAREISDKLQKMIEDAAEMQVQDLLPIVDAMKRDIGTSEADNFSKQADEALGNLVDQLKNAKEEYDNAIAVAQGETPASDMDNFDDDEFDMDDTTDMDDDDEDFDVDQDMDDEFGGDEAMTDQEDGTGEREMKAEF